MLIALALFTCAAAHAQRGLPRLAITDFRGTGASAVLVPAFNQALASGMAHARLFELAPKSFYPLRQPQAPADFRPFNDIAAQWTRPPVQASHLVFGYAAEQNGTFVLYGYLFDLHQRSDEAAQLLAKRYFESMNDTGARNAAIDFAKDIVRSLCGSRQGDPDAGREIIWVKRNYELQQ